MSRLRAVHLQFILPPTPVLPKGRHTAIRDEAPPIDGQSVEAMATLAMKAEKLELEDRSRGGRIGERDVCVRINTMLETENEYLCQDYLGAIGPDEGGSIDEVCRNKMCEWIFHVVDSTKLRRDTAGQAMNILDRFLGTGSRRAWEVTRNAYGQRNNEDGTRHTHQPSVEGELPEPVRDSQPCTRAPARLRRTSGREDIQPLPIPDRTGDWGLRLRAPAQVDHRDRRRLQLAGRRGPRGLSHPRQDPLRPVHRAPVRHRPRVAVAGSGAGAAAGELRAVVGLPVEADVSALRVEQVGGRGRPLPQVGRELARVCRERGGVIARVRSLDRKKARSNLKV